MSSYNRLGIKAAGAIALVVLGAVAHAGTRTPAGIERLTYHAGASYCLPGDGPDLGELTVWLMQMDDSPHPGGGRNIR